MSDYYTFKNSSIVIVGGGFCGIMTAINLIKTADKPYDITIINDGFPLSKGAAFSADSRSLKLNVPNSKMSAFPNDPDHFVNWLKKNNRSADKNSYSSRKDYGDYLSALWQDLICCLPANIKVETVEDYVEDIELINNSYKLSLRNTNNILADIIVLATGNSQPGTRMIPFKNVINAPRYFSNPWDPKIFGKIDQDSDVFLIGNGLTAADVIVTLMEGGFTKTIYTLSRNGFPLKSRGNNSSHHFQPNLNYFDEKNLTLIEILTHINLQKKIARSNGLSFDRFVDHLRPYTSKLWVGLKKSERLIFLNRLNSLWNNNRHRVEGETLEYLEKLASNGRVINYKGEITEVLVQTDGFEIFLNHHPKIPSFVAGNIINCSGPELDPKKCENVLLRNLAMKGMIVSDEIGLGFKADIETGAVLDFSGSINKSMFTLGGNLKGVFWESTAIPELSAQAAVVASEILKLQQGALKNEHVQGF